MMNGELAEYLSLLKLKVKNTSALIEVPKEIVTIISLNGVRKIRKTYYHFIDINL